MKNRKRKSYKGLKLIDIAGPQLGLTLLLTRADRLVKIDAEETHGMYAIGVEKEGLEKVVHVAGFRSARKRDKLLAEVRLARAAGKKTFHIPFSDAACPCCGNKKGHLFPVRDVVITEKNTKHNLPTGAALN